MAKTLGRPLTAVLLIPTGIGAAIGGFAGDGIPVARAIASVCDRLITHPNVLNGAQLYWPISNAWYVEGYGLDQFAAGEWGLAPVIQNRIGLVLDQAIEPDLRTRHLQAADAARATLGLTVSGAIMTDQPLGVGLRIADSGSSWGTLAHPDSLLRAAEKLLMDGATAIAVVARFPDALGEATLAAYRQGQGVDPLAGAEAVISHLVVRTFRVPCAHAPALQPLPLDPTLSPRSAAEELGYTFLPSVLVGLSQAPQFVLDPTPDAMVSDRPVAITRDAVDVVIVPASACGGRGVLRFAQAGVRILAIADNSTQLAVAPESLEISATVVQSYRDGLGWLAAYRAGVNPALLTAQTAVDALRSLL
jgi:hypothetical protein